MSKRDVTPRDITNLLAGTSAETRPYQTRIVGKTLAHLFDHNVRSVLIESPTGSGKTVMALLACKAIQQEYGWRIGWVSMRRNLLGQAARENTAKGIAADIQFISMFDKNPPTDLDMIVVDEAQHDAASSMTHIHNLVRPKFILGMTATPFRTDRIKLCFEKIIKDAGIGRLIAEGWLAQYHHYTIPRWDVNTVVDFYLRDRQRWGQSLVYFHTLDQCRQAMDRLVAAGVRADFVDGQSDRDAQLDKFAAGDTEIIVNCMVLIEGFDCPALKTVFARPSCKGVTIQMCGRAFRKHADLPHKIIVQAEQGKWPFIKTALPEEQYLWKEGEWRSLKVNKHIDRIACNALAALATTQVQLPSFMTKNQFSIRGRARRNRPWEADPRTGLRPQSGELFDHGPDLPPFGQA